MKAVRTVAIVTVGVVALVAAIGGVASAATGVVWAPRADANTTVAPGGTLTFYVYALNVGDAATDGTMVTAQVRLPPGLTLASTPTGGGTSWTCSGAAGASAATCTSTDVTSPEPATHGPPDIQVTARASTDPSVAAGTQSVHVDVSGGATGAVPGSTDDPITFSSSPPGFGIDAFDQQLSDASGAAFTQAGGHPYAYSTEIRFNRGDNPRFGHLWPPEAARDVVTDLPPGLIGNPTAVSQCTVGELANSDGFVEQPLCPTGSQIGVATFVANYARAISGEIYLGPVSVFNMVPPPSAPARFGFNVAGTVVTLDARPRGSDYGISVDVRGSPEALALLETDLTIWGVPGDPSHDFERSCPGVKEPSDAGPTCPSDLAPAPFLRNPTSCTAAPGSPVSDGLVSSLHIDSWQHPGRLLPDGSPDLSDPAWQSASFVSHEPPGFPASPSDPSTPWGPHLLPTGCDAVPFDPAFSGGPSGSAAVSTPTAFSFDLTLPQDDSVGGIGEGDLRKAVVALPAGVRVSPASAQGLAGCSEAQIALGSNVDPSCPDGSKIGSVTIDTPLLAQPLAGSVYLASPHENPFGSLLALYIVAKGPGFALKLPGRVDADPVTGQLTTTFDNNPQLPFSRLHLAFNDGPQAPLVTPDMCGRYETDATLTSWSGKTVSSRSTFDVSSDGHGGPCPAVRPFTPDFFAGSTNPAAGRSSPFVVAVSRGDHQQELAGLTVHMPRGLLGHIKDVTLCSASDAAQGTCGEASRVGSVTVGAGAGSNPFYITNGRAYITGPYKGGPFGLSIVVPAIAGPFDLGDVNVRAAIQVDRSTSALTVVSDPFPTILDGIPLDVRDVRVSVDKSGFLLNGTSCSTRAVLASVQSTEGASENRATRYQLGGCDKLALKPRVTFAIGATHHTAAGATTPLTTVIEQTPGQSNLAAVGVTLPSTLNARLGVVSRYCTLDQFHSGHCEQARAGTAVATTPLLAHSLHGGAYFVRVAPTGLPDLMIALRGQVDLDLDGKVSIINNEILATRFGTIPDAPITKFTLRLVSGSHGPIGVLTNLCSTRGRTHKPRVVIRGQNGQRITVTPTYIVHGCTKPRTTKKRGK